MDSGDPDRDRHQHSRHADPGGERPVAIAITPDGKTAYVTNIGSGTVTPIATATNTAGTPIPVGSDPDAIAFTPDGKTAYVANSGSDTVTPIATATNTAGHADPGGRRPRPPSRSHPLPTGRLRSRAPPATRRPPGSLSALP